MASVWKIFPEDKLGEKVAEFYNKNLAFQYAEWMASQTSYPRGTVFIAIGDTSIGRYTSKG